MTTSRFFSPRKSYAKRFVLERFHRQFFAATPPGPHDVTEPNADEPSMPPTSSTSAMVVKGKDDITVYREH